MIDVDKLLEELRAERDLIDHAIGRLEIILRLREGDRPLSEPDPTPRVKSAERAKARPATFETEL